jgi:hypothetical protein
MERRSFYDPATAWNGSLSDAEGRAKWKDTEAALGGGRRAFVDVGALCDLLERTGKDDADLSNPGAGRSAALGLFWEADSLEQIPRGRLTFLRAFLSEARRIDAHFARRAHELESEGGSDGALNELSVCARQGHVNRAGLLWLLMRSARDAGEVASLLVALEERSFWHGTLWRAAFRACEQTVLAKRGVRAEEFGVAEESEDSKASPAVGAKKPKKKKKDLKKKLKKYAPVAALPDSSAGPRSGRIARRLCFWVRPSLEWAAKSALLARCNVLPRPADRETIAGSMRLHLDSAKWQRYKQLVRAMDPSLVASQDAAVDSAVSLEWDGAGSLVRAIVSQANGSFTEEFLSGATADALLRGANESGLGKLVGEAQLGPALRVSSDRQVFVHAEGTDVSIVWDSEVVFSDATTAPTRAGMLAWGSTPSVAGAVAFPYQIVTVTAEEGGSLKDVLAVLEKDDCFIVAPGFDEFVAGAALVGDVGNTRPPWLAGLLATWQADWTQAFRLAPGAEQPALLGSKWSGKRKAGKGKEEEESDEEDEDEIAMRVGAALAHLPPSSHVQMREAAGEGAALLQREPWESAQAVAPQQRRV